MVVSTLGFGLISAHAVASASSASPVKTGLVNPAVGSRLTFPTTPVSTQSNSRAALEQRLLAQARADHIPIEALSLPNLLGSAKITGGVVSPGASVAPAPMGIGTYGVRNTTGNPTAFNISTNSWEGTISLQSPVNTFLLDNDGALSTNGADNTFGVQLNAVMNNTTVLDSSTDAFWTQNVLYFNFAAPNTVTFLDNVWNFSSPAVSLTSGTIFSGNGTPVYPAYYYDFGPTFAVTYPLTVHLYLNSSITDDLANGYGYSTVRFGFDLVNGLTGLSEAAGIYDTVEFNSTTAFALVPPSPFLVDGSQLTPTGYIPYDAEIMLGGPGGGTTTSVFGISGSERLQYLSSGTYANAPSAWDIGSETGETSEGISETYTTAGTVLLSAGPSIVAPLWNATPGGNLGQATVSGPLSPSNAFVFFTPGTHLSANTAAWAPTRTATSVDYTVIPGTYTVSVMLSDYTPITKTVTVTAGHTASVTFTMKANSREGVYTPLVAWDNAQLAAISSGGKGTATHPYKLFNNPASGGLNSVFGEFNDYLYLVFPGVLLSGTTAYVDLVSPANNSVTFPTAYDPALADFGLPFTDNLQYELFNASNVAIWGATDITGWFFFDDYGPTGGLPIANVVVWDGQHDLIGDNTFESQGSALLLAGLSPEATPGNVVWGNTFDNSSVLAPTMYPGNGTANGPPFAIFAYEGGDLIYNNWVGTSITAYSPPVNMFNGAKQANAESWNLTAVEPAKYRTTFDGFTLTGAIVGAWQGGNFWIDYVVGTGLPYDEYGYIVTGGDSFPLPLIAYAVTFSVSGLFPGVEWSVTINGVTEKAKFPVRSIVFYEVPGAYSFTAAKVLGPGKITSPKGYDFTVSAANVYVTLLYIP
jgi:thermopsin